MNFWNPEYKSLDHWRGFAAVWVMSFHGFAAYGNIYHPITGIVFGFARYGYLGVDIFFVISGYCIGAMIYKLFLKKGTVGSFIQNRVWRIFPSYWAALLVAVVIKLTAIPFNHTSIWETIPPSWQFWIAHILLAQPYFNATNFVGVYWTLTIELAFYLMVAILLFMRNKLSSYLTISICLFFASISPFISHNFPITFLSYWGEFVCGILVFLAIYFRQNREDASQQVSALSLLLIFSLVCLGSWANWSFQSQSNLWFSGCFAILLYVLYGLDKHIDCTQQIQWLKDIGIFSYSLYLIHVPFMEKIINFCMKKITTNSPLFLLLVIFSWVVAITMSYLFYRVVEKPINDWRHHRKSLQ